MPVASRPGYAIVKATVTRAPMVVGRDVTLRVEVERDDGKCEQFLVISCAPGLYEYRPYVDEVRKAIERVLTEREAEMRTMFAAMPASDSRR
jgi:hypothetical protein